MRSSVLLISFCMLPLFRLPAAAAPLKINQQIEKTLTDLGAKHAFEAVLPKDWKSEGFAVSPDRIEVTFSDKGKRQHSVELLLEEPQGKVDGHGHVFHFRLKSGAADTLDAKALLQVAAIIDAATPMEALVAEAPPPSPQPPPVVAVPPPAPQGVVVQPPPPPPPRSWFQRLNDTQASVPKAVALVLGAIQVLIIVGAILIAIFLPARRHDDDQNQP